MAAAILLQPGDPLPALPTANQVWRAEDFGRNWAVIALAPPLPPPALPEFAPNVAVLAIVSPAVTPLPAGFSADRADLACAQRLGARTDLAETVAVAVVVQPSGTVAWAGGGAFAQACAGARQFLAEATAPRP